MYDYIKGALAFKNADTAVIENNEADGHLDQKKLRYIEAEVLCCLEKLQIVPLFCITDFIYIVKLHKKLGKIL